MSYILTLDPAAEYDLRKIHDDVESSILDPPNYEDLNHISIDLKKKKTILLLYLNKKTFLHQRDNLKKTIMATKNAGIDIVLVLEQDSIMRSWCEFSQFFLSRHSCNTCLPLVSCVVRWKFHLIQGVSIVS